MRRSSLSNILSKLPTFVFVIFFSSGVASAQIGYVRSDGVSSIVYSGPDYHLYELYRLTDGWHLGELSALVGFARRFWRHEELTALTAPGSFPDEN